MLDTPNTTNYNDTMTSDFALEDGMPVERTRYRYPFASMKVGQSFVAPDERVRAAASRYAARTGMRFTVNKTPEGTGYRCHRIA